MKRLNVSSKAPATLLGAIALALTLLLLAGCPTTDSLYGQAYGHFVNREEVQALALLSVIIEKDARYTPAYVLKAAIYEAKGDWNETEAVLLQAQQAAPPSSVVCFNLGNIYFKKGDFKKATVSYSQALVLNPVLHEAYINRANASMALADYPAALKDYEIFLGLTDKDYPNVTALVRLLRRDLGLAPAPVAP